MIAASRRWTNDRPWQAFSRADVSSLVNTGTTFSVTLGARSPAIGVGDLLLLGQPPEELLQRPELAAGIGVAVPGQQVHHPSLHVMTADLLPPGARGPGDQVRGGEPGHGLGIGPHRLRCLALGGQVQPERLDLRRADRRPAAWTAAGVVAGRPSFSLFLRLRSRARI
jgi:hypothetical protein